MILNKEFKKVIDFIRDLYKSSEDPIPLHAPVFKGNEKKYVNECIDSTYVSSVGKFVDDFELKIAEYTQASKAVACVNGSNALYLALKLVGVKNDEEVITQPLSFVATANAISYCGAKPVFVDVDLNTLGLSPSSLLKFIEKNVMIDSKTGDPFNRITKKKIAAVVPMHTYGHPCMIDIIKDICKRYNLPLVEDAAESMGSFYNNKHTGTFGEIGVLSFNGNKVITTGGGGILLFKDDELAQKAKHLTTQAKVKHEWEFIHDDVGYNFRMPNINAALGLAQLEYLNDTITIKRNISKSYQDFFKSIETIDFFHEPKNAKSNYWLNCIFLKDLELRDKFLHYCNENGVMCRPAWKLLNQLSMYNKCVADDISNAIWISERLVNLPSSAL